MSNVAGARSWVTKHKILSIVGGLILLVIIASAIRSNPAPTSNTTATVSKPAVNLQATPKSKPVAPVTTSMPAATPTPTPAPTHTVIYQFSLMSGSLSASDEQNVGINWHDPTTGKNQIPSDIQGAVHQLGSGGYNVTYKVNSVNKDMLYDGVNNYSDPDATIACTILVDNSPVSNEIAPKSGYADCSGNGLDSQSGN